VDSYPPLLAVDTSCRFAAAAGGAGWAATNSLRRLFVDDCYDLTKRSIRILIDLIILFVSVLLLCYTGSKF